MPTNITDVSAFTDPVVGPADGDALNAASALTGLQGLANRTRKLVDRTTGPAGAGEFVYDAPKTRDRLYGRRDFRPDVPASWDLTVVGAGSYAAAVPLANSLGGNFEIADLPFGASVVQVDVMAGTSVSRLAANRWKVELFSVVRDFVTPTVTQASKGVQIDDLGVFAAHLTMGWVVTPFDVVTGGSLVVQVIGPNGGLAAGDALYGVRVRYAELGPRTF